MKATFATFFDLFRGGKKDKKELLTRNGRDSKNKKLCWADINQIIFITHDIFYHVSELHFVTKPSRRNVAASGQCVVSQTKKYHSDNVVAKKQTNPNAHLWQALKSHNVGGGIKKIPAFHMVVPLQCK